MNEKFFTSVKLDADLCKGCINCIKRCPTEAIRVRNGKAEITNEFCIDCGECIRICPHHAKLPSYDKLEVLNDYEYTVALPAPALYGQFNNLDDVNIVLTALKRVGFDDVYEVAKAAEIVSNYTRIFLKSEGIKKPVISSACPVISRLISLRFPYLKDNILPMLPPMEISAMEARKKAKEEHPELSDEDIGVFFISPCAAKVSYIRNGYGDYKSNVDVVVPLNDIYFMLLGAMKKNVTPTISSEAGMIGIGWATSGGESSAILNDSYLFADGIENCIQVLESIENGNIPQIEFVELNACIGGCVGGVMTIENPFIAKTRLQTVRRYMPVSKNFISSDINFEPDSFITESLPDYTPISRLSESMSESMRMMAKMQEIRKTLPGIDCGACGAPTCRAFAEDIVRGVANDRKCVVLEHSRLDNSDKGATEDDS